MQARRRLIGKRRIATGVLVLAAVLGGALPAGAGDVVYRVVGVVPFPANARPGAAADPLDAEPKPDWVDDGYWDQLVFNLLDKPGQDTAVIRTRALTSEHLASLDIHIATAAPEAGVAPISDEMVTWWKRALPDAVRKFTGRPWQGRLTSGTSTRPADVTGQVNIRIGTAAEFNGRPTTCAYALTNFYTYPDGSFAAWDSSEIIISPTAQDKCSIHDDQQSYTMAHELGHVLGLSHVDDTTDLMHGNETANNSYTQRLIDHSQLLYRTGPTVSHPGFADSAASRWTVYITDAAFNAATREWSFTLSHDGNEAGTPTQELAVAMQFHIGNGDRLDRDGDFVLGYDQDLSVSEILTLRSGLADNFWTPRYWATVTLLTGIRSAGRSDLFAVDCIDGDGKGKTRIVDIGGEEISACVYQHVDLNPGPAGWLIEIADLAYDASTRKWSGTLSHNGARLGASTQAVEVEMQFHDVNGHRRLDRDREFVLRFDQELSAEAVLPFDVGPADNFLTPQGWQTVTLGANVHPSGRSALFAVQNRDSDGKGEFWNIEGRREQVGGRRYQRSELDPSPPKWTLFVSDFTYIALSHNWRGSLRHNGGEKGASTRATEIAFQFHDDSGGRLDRDGQFVTSIDAAIAPDPTQFRFIRGPGNNGFLAPQNWATVTLLTSVRPVDLGKLIAVDCVDGDGKGETRTVDHDGKQISACFYRRSEIDPAGTAKWTVSIADLGYDAATRVWSGRLNHNGGERDTLATRLEMVMQFHDIDGNRLDDSEIMRIYHNESSATETLPFNFLSYSGSNYLTPRNWATVTLLTSLNPADLGELVAVDCVDTDDKGETRTADRDGKQVSACFYRRSEIDPASAGWRLDIADLAYDEPARLWSGSLGHNGAGADTSTQAMEVAMQFHDTDGERLDRDGDFVLHYDQEVAADGMALEFKAGPGSNFLTPREWATVTLLASLRPTGHDALVAVDCFDNDGKGKIQAVSRDGRQLVACFYQRSEIDPTASKWRLAVADLAYDAASRTWSSTLSHNGNETGTSTQALVVAMQFHDANGERLDSDGQFVRRFDQELDAGTALPLRFRFGSPAPRDWATVTLLTSVRLAGRRALFAVDCTDRDGKGNAVNVDVNGEQVSACSYRRSEIAATPVPALPLAGVLLLAGLLGAIGLRRRQTATAP